MTLQQQVMNLIGQWHGLDATERSQRQEQLANELISLLSQQSRGHKPAAPSAFCAFCAPRYLDSFVSTFAANGGRRHSAA